MSLETPHTQCQVQDWISNLLENIATRDVDELQPVSADVGVAGREIQKWEKKKQQSNRKQQKMALRGQLSTYIVVLIKVCLKKVKTTMYFGL